MKQTTFSDDFYFALTTFLLHAKQQVIAAAAEFGLTGVQALTLLNMRVGQQQSMSELCRVYDCDASNLTGIIDGLEQKDLVSRQTHPHDRRVKIVHLEADGQKLQKKLIHKIAETSPQLFGNLTPEEAKQLALLIQKSITD